MECSVVMLLGPGCRGGVGGVGKGTESGVDQDSAVLWGLASSNQSEGKPLAFPETVTWGEIES